MLTKAISLAGRSSLQVSGTLVGVKGRQKYIVMTFLPLRDDKLLEIHLTREMSASEE